MKADILRNDITQRASALASGRGKWMHRRRNGPLRSALFHQEKADALQKFGGLVHPLGHEEIGARFVLVNLYATGDQNCGSLRREGFDLLDELRTVHTVRH